VDFVEVVDCVDILWPCTCVDQSIKALGYKNASNPPYLYPLFRVLSKNAHFLIFSFSPFFYRRTSMISAAAPGLDLLVKALDGGAAHGDSGTSQCTGPGTAQLQDPDRSERTARCTGLSNLVCPGVDAITI
jgi:hypothetical protein